MSAKHTKSPSGRTHRLTVTYRGTTTSFERRYKSAPKFDDQVQGDLIREYRAQGGGLFIGLLPTTVDPLLAEAITTGKPLTDLIIEAREAVANQPDHSDLIKRLADELEARL